MSRTTKDPIALVRAAMAAGKAALPQYSHRFSPHRFTQAQLLALLVLRQFFGTDYRGLVTLLHHWAELRQALGLKRVPNYSTLCRAQARLGKKGELAALGQHLSRHSRAQPSTTRCRRRFDGS